MEDFISSSKYKINKRIISLNNPTYFIADIAANHDGSLSRAKELIFLAKECGADAVKFQHFVADNIVSDYGFKNLKKIETHQSKWKKSVFEILDFQIHEKFVLFDYLHHHQE